MKNPYQYIKDKTTIRPYNDKKKTDGNFNYIHQEDAFNLAYEIIKLRRELKNRKNKQ